MELAQDLRSKSDITADELYNAGPLTMWPITYCINTLNICDEANWNHAILTKLSVRNADFAIRNLVVINDTNPVVKWEDDPSGLKDDWKLYYKPVTSQHVYNVVHPVYQQCDDMEIFSLYHNPSTSSESDNDNSSDMSSDSNEGDDNYVDDQRECSCSMFIST